MFQPGVKTEDKLGAKSGEIKEFENKGFFSIYNLPLHNMKPSVSQNLNIRILLAPCHLLFSVIFSQGSDGPSHASRKLEECRHSARARRKCPIGRLSSS